MVAVDSHIPAAADAQVGATGHYLYQAPVVYRVEDFTGAVGGMVVDHDDIIREVGLLGQGALHGVGNGLLAIEHGNDDRGLAGEVLLVEVGLAVEVGVDDGSHLLEMGCAGTLHLNLYLAVARIDIVELFLTALAGVELGLGVEIFVEMEYLALSAQIQAQVVESGILIIHTVGLRHIVEQRLRLDEPQAAEVEVVAEASCLIVDGGMLRQGAFLQGVVVAVDHHRSRVVGSAQKAFQGIEPPAHRRHPGAQQQIVGIRVLGYAHHRVG